MPLVACPDCQSDLSTDAIACPKCGRPMIKPAEISLGLALKAIAIVGAVITIVALMIFGRECSAPQRSAAPIPVQTTAAASAKSVAKVESCYLYFGPENVFSVASEALVPTFPSRDDFVAFYDAKLIAKDPVAATKALQNVASFELANTQVEVFGFDLGSMKVVSKTAGVVWIHPTWCHDGPLAGE